jgi:hypothetical protein
MSGFSYANLIGVKGYAGRKYSSAYIPPELIHVEGNASSVG